MQKLTSIAVTFILAGVAAQARAEDAAAGKGIKILSGKPRLIVVNGYSTSFRWPMILQRKLDRFFDGKRVVEVVSAIKGGTPVAKWIDVKTGKPLPAWSRVTNALKRKGDRPAIVLAQQSLQWAFGARTAGIRGPKDAEHIKQGADILEKYVRLLSRDGADLVFVAMHIYKHPMEPEIGNERLALAALVERKIPNFRAGPDVWTPTKAVYPRGFAGDRLHPGEAAIEIMAQLWFETLLKHDGLDVPAWSRKKMEPVAKAPAVGKSAEPPVRQLRERHNRMKPELQKLVAQFKPHTFEYGQGKTMPYRLFEPKQKPGTKYPLVIFLHGAGGRGKDNKRQIHDQIAGPCVWALPANQARHPCFVLAPQSSGGWAWSGRMVPVAKSLIDKIAGDHPIDASRIYLTGLSMGGYGTWSLLGAYPDFFAAGMPVCGKGDPSKAAALVKHKVAIWAFHGAKDSVVSANGSRGMIAAIRKAGGQPKYTEYGDVGHNSWEGAYTDPNLVEWTFAQQRKK